jgi:hypothetical protein
MHHPGMSCRGNAESHPCAVMPRRMRGIQYSRGVSIQAQTSLQYWIARSSAQLRTSLAMTLICCLTFE